MTPTPDSYHRIDLANADDVAAWLRYFTCSEVVLRDAVAVAGTLLADVEQHLAHQVRYSRLAEQFDSLAFFQDYYRSLNP